MSFRNVIIATIILSFIGNITGSNNSNNVAQCLRLNIKKYKANAPSNTTDIYGGSKPILTDNYKQIINDKYNRRVYLRKREDRYLF